MNESINQINQPPSSHRQEADRLLVAGRHGRDLGGKVVGLLFDSFADHQPAESDHLRVVLVEQLLDGHVAVLYVVLRDEALFFEEFADAALDHLFDDGLRLAAVEGLLGQDALFVLEDVGGNVGGRGERRVHRRHVHGNVGTELRGSALQLDQDTDGAHVDVPADNGLAVSAGGHSANLDVFTDLRDERLPGGLEGFSVDLLFHQGFDGCSVHADGGSGDALAVSDEGRVLSDKVGLAVDLDHDGFSVASGGNGDLSLGGHAGGLLVGLGQPLLSEELGGGFLVSVALGQGLLAIHHTGTGFVTELLDGFRRDFSSHEKIRGGASCGLLAAGRGEKGGSRGSRKKEEAERKLHGGCVYYFVS
mmetsp:Transcript_3256/g.7424  ORF Transcript_3256/g.7424 Transcript_3256/m.7424 type:complete len:362 (-) Transcript_3256:81-1166(-)